MCVSFSLRIGFLAENTRTRLDAGRCREIRESKTHIFEERRRQRVDYIVREKEKQTSIPDPRERKCFARGHESSVKTKRARASRDISRLFIRSLWVGVRTRAVKRAARSVCLCLKAISRENIRARCDCVIFDAFKEHRFSASRTEKLLWNSVFSRAFTQYGGIYFLSALGNVHSHETVDKQINDDTHREREKESAPKQKVKTQPSG